LVWRVGVGLGGEDEKEGWRGARWRDGGLLDVPMFERGTKILFLSKG
jgi:hypothetical protein